jgi:hypothetical protein
MRKAEVLLALMIMLLVTFSAFGKKLSWTGNTNLIMESQDNSRTGQSSLLFDTNIDEAPTSRMVSANFGAKIKGTLEGWLLDDPALKPVWITFGSEMSNCIGVQFGRQANYTLRVGGTNNVDTQVPRIQGWVGFRLEFTGAEVMYYISTDDGKSWQEVGSSEEFKTFNSIHLRNNENTGASKMAAYFDDIRVTDSDGNTVIFEGFGSDADPLSVSSGVRLTAMWGRIKTLGAIYENAFLQ